MSMDLKGITWVGNMYQKFENIWLEVEETMLEETMKYMEKTVGESVKKICSDVMQDLVPPSSCDLGEKQVLELPVDQYTGADFCKKSLQGSKKITVKADNEQTTKESKTNYDVDIDVIHTESYDSDDYIMTASGISIRGNNFIPHAGRYVGSTDEEKEDMSSSFSVLYGDPCEFSMVKPMQPEDCSYDTVIVSCPETWNSDIAKVDIAVIEQGHKTRHQDDELKLEETCVMVTRDDLQFVPKARVNNAKTGKQSFSLSKKSARKQEYEELAIWHGNDEKGKSDCLESSGPTLLEDEKKLLLPDISEPEWELL